MSLGWPTNYANPRNQNLSLLKYFLVRVVPKEVSLYEYLNKFVLLRTPQLNFFDSIVTYKNLYAVT